MTLVLFRCYSLKNLHSTTVTLSIFYKIALVFYEKCIDNYLKTKRFSKNSTILTKTIFVKKTLQL